MPVSIHCNTSVRANPVSVAVALRKAVRIGSILYPLKRIVKNSRHILHCIIGQLASGYFVPGICFQKSLCIFLLDRAISGVLHFCNAENAALDIIPKVLKHSSHVPFGLGQFRPVIIRQGAPRIAFGSRAVFSLPQD